MTWLIIAVAVVALFVVYLASTAGRLDRLHHRVDTALVSLDVQLRRRTNAVMDLASSGMLDPASSLVLADSALVARDDEGDPRGRSQQESDVTKAIDVVFGSRADVEEFCKSARGAELIDVLSGTVHRAALSRRFYNDAVRACRAVRRQRLVGWFRLAGSAQMPLTVEMDDQVPSGLRNR
ncbi:MAG: hypothetical protein ACOYD0_13015 [Candidatus Nanopelagicales bacterium]